MTHGQETAFNPDANSSIEHHKDPAGEFLEGGAGADPPGRPGDEIGEQARDILESITDGFCAFDCEWRFIYFNAAAERVAGLPRSEILGRSQWELFPATRGTIVEREYRRAVRDQVAVEFEVWYEPWGRWYAVRAYPAKDDRLFVYFRDISERKQATEAFQESEARFRALVEASAQFVWSTDAEGAVIEDSPSWRAFTGQSYEEFKGSGWLDCIHPDDQARTAASWRKTVTTRAAYSIEYRVRHVSGEWRWTVVRGAPLEAVDGKIKGWIGMNIDITARKNAERERDRINALLTTILDSSPDVIAAKDLEGRYLALNEATARMIGRPVAKLVGRTDQELADPKIAEPIMAVDREVMRTGRIVSTDERYPDAAGGMRFFHSIKAPLRDGTGTPAGVVVVSRDVTRQKQIEDALRKSEEEFRTLADNISQFTWMTDEKGWVFWYNRRWYDYTGARPEDMRGWGWREVVHPEHVTRVLEHISHCFETGEVWEDTFPLRGGDGTYRWFLSRALPIRNAEGGIARWFGTNTDVTAQLETEQQLRRANADLEQFAYSASHDLQEPLRNVSIYSELLVKRHSANLDGEAREFLEYLKGGALRMEMLVRDLLAYTQVSQLGVSSEEADANAALKTAISNLANAIAESDAQITASALPAIRAHHVHLQQIFQNLVGNALKYRGRARPLVHVEAKQQDGYWRFSVRDNGIGIGPEYKERIFGIFKRLHTSDEYPGTGIGLAICQRIVERYHGRIWVESRPGEGSTFYFTLA